jgi:NADPH2:quinone reductase
MRAIVYSKTGDPSVLDLVEREAAEPGAGEVRVRVVVSGVNPTDWKSRAASDGEPTPFPEVVPNQDGSGVIDAVGPGVDDLTVGDRVWMLLSAHGRPTGTAQELTVVPADRVVRLPDGVSHDIGASLGVPAVTAHRALTIHDGGPSRLAPGALDGRTVLVAGGAGAVGHAAIQLARWAGATVVTTISSPEKAALATSAGAHHTVDYTAGDPAAAIKEIAPDGVDIVVEVAPAVNAELNQAVIANGGSIAVYANNGGDTLQLDIVPSFVRNIRYQFLLLYTLDPAAIKAATEDVTAALEAGVLPVGEDAGLPLVRFSLEQTADAHAAVENSVVGKVLIDVSDE